ncbi:MAG: hypothetical protein OXG35_32145 [Acidobacteria bacterium]|nr:hypothetical protein [Acidobacteriota bacterium]
MSPIPRKPVDRTFRVLIDLPERWRTYITNDDRTCFEHDEPDEPWNQAAADREIARIEAEGCYLAGPADDPNEPELGRFGGIDGALITYVAHRHDVLEADAARGLWRFLAPNGEEYLLKTGQEGIVWLPAHWASRVLDPTSEIDENDLRWPDDRGDPQHPPLVDENQTPPGWRRGYPAGPPPENLEHWDEAACLETIEALDKTGWTIEQPLEHVDRMGWFRRAWGPLSPCVVTRTQAAANEPRQDRPDPACPVVESR